MVSIRNQLTFVVFAVAVAVVAVSATTLRIGRRVPGDGLVCHGEVNFPAKYGQAVAAQRICNVPRWNQTITYIYALDLGRPGRGGSAQVIRGGLNQKNVTILLRSQISQPLNFTLQVYAKPYW